MWNWNWVKGFDRHLSYVFLWEENILKLLYILSVIFFTKFTKRLNMINGTVGYKHMRKRNWWIQWYGGHITIDPKLEESKILVCSPYRNVFHKVVKRRKSFKELVFVISYNGFKMLSRHGLEKVLFLGLAQQIWKFKRFL